MQTCRNLLKYVNSHRLPPTDVSLRVQLLPPLATIALVQALEKLNIDYITSDGESDQDVISLGIYLRCPVISNDSDFYVTIPSTIEGVCFLPMNFVSFEPIVNYFKCNTCRSQGRSCAYLTCQQFLPNGPGLKTLPDVQRPLLASLLGNDYITSDKFLKALPVSEGKTKLLSKSATKEMKIKRRRNIIVSLINWLSDFGVDIQEPINRILDRYPKSERSRRHNELTQSLQSYKTDPESLYFSFAKHLRSVTVSRDEIIFEESKNTLESDTCSTNSSFLHHSSVPTSSCPSECSSDVGECQLSDIQYNNDDDDRCEYITQSSIHANAFKITSYWPELLLEAFRKYRIVPIFLDAIYSSGSVLVCGIEAMNDTKSIYADSFYLRTLIYNLVLGIESTVTSRYPDNLIGVQKSGSLYYVTELDRKSSFNIKRRTVPVRPILSLSSREMDKTDRRLSFLQEYVGFKYQPLDSKHTSWLTSLALLNVLNCRNRCIFCPTDDITVCPVSLTFSAICICTYLLISHYQYSDLSYCKPLKKHFYNCADYFTTQLHINTQTTKRSNKQGSGQHSLNMRCVHTYGQLQIHYMVLSTLINLLNCLANDNERKKLPTCLDLPPICSVFPSGYLFHEVHHCISLIKPVGERHQYVRNVIFKKLMNYQDNDKYFNDALNLFDDYLKTLSYIQSTVSLNKCLTSATDTTRLSEKLEKVKLTSMLHLVEQESGSVKLKKKYSKRGKHHKKSLKQPTYAEIEERVTKLMHENGLLD